MLYSFEDETTHSASLPSTLDMPRTALHYSGLWAVGEFKMKASETKRLGEELLRQPVKRVNNLPKLLTCVGGVGDENPTGTALSPENKLHAWLKQKYDSFCQALEGLLQAPNNNLQVSALNAIMELVRGQQVGVFDKGLFSKALTVLLQSQTVDEETLQLLLSKYMVYADVRFYTLRAIHKMSEDSLRPSGVLQSGRRLFQVLASISPTLSAGTESEEVQSWCGAIEAGVVEAAPAPGEGSHQRRKRKREQALTAESSPLLGAVQWANPAAYKRAFSEAWLGLLTMPLPSDLLKKVLVQLHSTVMPHMPNPLLLSDFLTRCLDEGGLVGMLALNGIFTLVTKHGLEYPNFYSRLYGLLQAPVFRAKYRAQFLQLADIFLSSGMVPAYTAAAFIKKFARLALTAPPAGAIIAIAFIHNLLRRHPSCSVLLNKPLSSTSHSSDAAAQKAASTASQKGAVTPAANMTATAAQTSLPHTLTNGHCKGHIQGDDTSSSSQADKHSSSDSLAADAAAVDEARVQTQEAAMSGIGSAGGIGAVGQDVFDKHEADPAKCRAIESSLWELESLRHHYYHAVANYVSILDKDLGDRKRTAEVDVGALLRSSYSEYLTLETEKRLKSVPVAFYSAPPSQLFHNAAKVDFPGWVC